MKHTELAFLRSLIAGTLTVFVVALLLSNALLERDRANRQIELQVRNQSARILALDAEVQALKERWFGVPAIWQPPAIPSTRTIFFSITGSTQVQIITSLDHSDICKNYGPCAEDPAVPGGIAWGLEGLQPVAKFYYCTTPKTTTSPYRVMVVLPKWAPTPDGVVTIGLVDKWNALEQAIYVHEAGHAAISRTNIAAWTSKARGLRTCQAVFNLWDTLPAKEDADQAAYHARLHADCRPEIGCLPSGWLGWS